MTYQEQQDAWNRQFQRVRLGKSTQIQLKAASNIYMMVSCRATRANKDTQYPTLVPWVDRPEFEDESLGIEFYGCVNVRGPILSFGIQTTGQIETVLLEPYHNCVGKLFGIDHQWTYFDRMRETTILMIDRFISLCPDMGEL